jgi:hypothetical protein
VDERALSYRALVEGKLDTIGVRRMDFPSTSISDVVKGIVNREPPIKESGVGVGDYLIWQSVLELRMATPLDERIVFVSNNHKDFFQRTSGDEWEFHPQLRADLRSRNLPENSISLYLSIGDFLKLEVEPRLKRVSELANQALEQIKLQVSAAISAWYEHNHLSLIPPKELVQDDWARVSNVGIGDISQLSIIRALELSGDEISVELVVHIDVVFTVIFGTHEQFIEQNVGFTEYQPVGPVHDFNQNKRFLVSAVVGQAPEFTLKTIRAIPILVIGSGSSQMVVVPGSTPE